MKRKIFILLAIVAVIILSRGLSHEPSYSDSYSHADVKIGGETFDALVADTDELKEKGLSGFQGLGERQAMLFPYDEPASLPFWMKGMLFSIDILWLDSNYRVVHMEKRVPPDSYPKSFSSTAPAQHVLEFPSGTLDRLGIIIGDEVSIFPKK